MRLGQRCGVSESSIVRFATTLGYSGYSEMQRELQELLKLRLTASQRFKATASEDNSSILHTIMQRGIGSIQYAMENLNEEMFEQAVELLAKSERVFLIGSRSSYGLVYYFGFVLSWIRGEVQSLNGSFDCIDALATLTDRDLVLSISLPKYPRSTVKALKAAYEKGAHTVVITDTMTSPLVPYAEVPLLTYTEMVSYSDNVAPVMCLITALLTAVGAADQKRTTEMLEKHEAYWSRSELYV